MLLEVARRCAAMAVVGMVAACAEIVFPPKAEPTAAETPVSAASTATRPTERRLLEPAEAKAPRLKQSVSFGSDRFVDTRAYGAGGATAMGEGEVALNFADADVREVARSVLGDILAVNFTIDPAVTGRVTIQTSQPIERADLLPTLETLLRSNGAALLREGDLYKVVSLADRSGTTVPLRPGGATDAGEAGFGIQVVPLRHIAASEMAEILALFAPEGSLLKADDARNLLILSGTRADRAALLDAVGLFDVDSFKGMSFGLFPLDNANAETLVNDLRAIFVESGYAPSHELLRFVPVARLNAVIAISPRASYLEQAQAWIERLDQGIDGVSERLHVYAVQNVRAGELAEVLNEVFDGAGPSGPSQAPASPIVPVSLRSEPPAGEGDAEPLPAGEAALSSSDAGEGISLGGRGDVKVIADESTNSLLVLATPQTYRMVEQAIRKLDIVPLQVLVEATIAEVTLNDALRYGVQWFFDSGDSEFTLSEFAGGAATPVFPGFSYLFQMTQDVRVVLNALSNVTDVNIISSPQLMVLDNQTAELQVGDEVPIATQSAVSVADPQAPIVNSIEFRDTGVILRVTPRVNAGGLVVMEIEQEVSSVVNTTTSGIDSPTIQQRRITSSVAIQGGQTVALGGLISESRERGSSGVPLLSEIPVLGALFGRKVDNEVRTELLVLITPRVVANQVDAREVTEELRARLRAVLPLGAKVK